MNITGIIAEYNPFHNGHRHHIQQTRRLLPDAAVMVIMSGSMCQRGDVCITDKWTRAACAVHSGADLVVELPAVYAISSAEYFARAGVSIIADAGATHLSFGSECGDVDTLTRAAEIVTDPALKPILSKYLDTGLSFPVARQRAAEQLTGMDMSILAHPNNILAIEYIKAIKSLTSSKVKGDKLVLQPLTVPRRGTNYHDQHEHDSFASASYIRSLVANGKPIDHLLPESTRPILKDAVQRGFFPADPTTLHHALPFLLRGMTLGQIRALPEVTEGLENRLYRAFQQHSTVADILTHVKTKRYTLSRLRHILAAAALGLRKDDLTLPCTYLRVLALNANGQKILRHVKETSSLTILNNLGRDVAKLDEQAQHLLSFDIRATGLFTLCLPEPKDALLDYEISPIVFE